MPNMCHGTNEDSQVSGLPTVWFVVGVGMPLANVKRVCVGCFLLFFQQAFPFSKFLQICGPGPGGLSVKNC